MPPLQEKPSLGRLRLGLIVAGLLAVVTALVVASSGVPHAQAQARAGGAPAPADPSGGYQPCFGAAARDPVRTCVNPRLKLEVVPGPDVARTLPNTPCQLIAGEPDVCEFGVDPAQATQTIALVGDSHAGHWRGALETVALRHRWRGVSITHTSCPLSKAVRNLPAAGGRFAACVAWKHAVFAWFEQHPEVHTVFVAGLSGGMGVFPSGGRSRFETAVAGYLAAWKALPPTVRHIVVIRDTPKVLWTTNTCVAQAVAAQETPGTACAVPRKTRLDPDPLVAAAHRLNSPRVRVVDLTSSFCDDRLCYPVIGGALVFRDENHMTAVYSTSLGPYLLGAVDHALAASAGRPRARAR